MIDLRLGDCLQVLKDIPDNSVDSVVTDPPYGLSFMGKKWDYDVPSQEIWEECLRVLKPGGYLLSFAGTRTQHRMAVRIEDAGFEIRDMIAWVYASGFPKSLNIGKAVDKLQGNKRDVVGKHPYANRGTAQSKQSVNLSGSPERSQFLDKGTSEWEGWGTALKPALEPITVARKPLSEKNVAENALKWGTGGIDIDGSRIEYQEQGEDPGLGGKGSWKPTRVPVGHTFSPPAIELETSRLGRFPANLIHDGSDEVVRLFPESKSTQSNRGNINIGKMAGGSGQVDGTDTIRGHNDSGSASRFFYCAKASKSERNRGCEGMEEKHDNKGAGLGARRCSNCSKWEDDAGHPKCDCEIPNFERVERNTKNNHPTVKPIALMEYLVKLVSREGAIVLDPFMGSGTTGIACRNLKRDFIGIEIDPDYMKIAKARIDSVYQEMML